MGSDLCLRGDVQVLLAGVEQQVLVDLVSGGAAQRLAVNLGSSRQMQLQHLQSRNRKWKSYRQRRAGTTVAAAKTHFKQKLL